MDQQDVGSKRAAASGAGKMAAKSHEAAEQLKDAVVGHVNQTRQRALSVQGDTSERIRGVAAHLRELSDSLREQDPLVSNLAQRAGQGVEGLARYVGDATPENVIRDTEQLARQKPALFYGGAFLVGLAAARFIKNARPAGYPTEGSDRSGGGVDQPRLERQSGFFPADRNARSNQRFQENYAATFGRGDPLASAGGASRVSSASPAQPVSPPLPERRGGDATPERARKGDLS
jgi:hypothetical protein